MSDSNKKKTQSAGENPGKVLTKYDRKVQRRKEQKARDERNKKIGKAAGIAAAVLLVCFVASFPIRTFLTVNGAYVTIGGEKVTRVEFDYNFYNAKNNYLASNGSWLSYLGINLSGNLAAQWYSEDMTWKDYFDEVAVNNIRQTRALAKEARAAGFEYNVAEEYGEYLEAMKKYASDAGISEKVYLQEAYGPFATEARIRPYVQEAIYVNAYYADVVEKMIPSEEEISRHYEENRADYDSVDYRVATVDAKLPTEPTGSADSAGTEEQGGSDGTSSYQPTDEEIAAAMAEAKSEADQLLKTIKTEGEQMVGLVRADVNYLLRDWFFAEERKAGDTTIIEDSTYHRYYVVAFEKRYLDETLTANIRVIMTADGNGQAILDEWKGGEATEESFAKLCDKYNDPDVISAEGGHLEGADPRKLAEELKSWITAADRTGGDTAVIAPEGSSYQYVIYYVAPNRPAWIYSIENEIQSERAQEYLDGIVEGLNVEDKKGNLNYLKVYAAREEAAASETPAP